MDIGKIALPNPQGKSLTEEFTDYDAFRTYFRYLFLEAYSEFIHKDEWEHVVTLTSKMVWDLGKAHAVYVSNDPPSYIKGFTFKGSIERTIREWAKE